MKSKSDMAQKNQPGTPAALTHRVTFVLLLALALLTGGVIGAARVRHEYACLYFPGALQGRGWLLDVHTGSTAPDPRQAETSSDREVSVEWRAADGAHVAYLRPDSDNLVSYTLYVQPTGFQGDEQVTTLENGVIVLGFAWSPDSSLMAYVWHDPAGYVSLTIVDPAGRQRRQETLLGGGNLDVVFHGWSADSAYVAASARAPDGRAIWFRAAADFHAVAFPTPKDLPHIENVTWSPRGNRIAYLRTSALYTSRLVVVLLGDQDEGGDAELTLDLPSAHNTRLLWSPDGRYLALRYTDEQLYWHLALYQISDGGVHRVEEFIQGNRLLWPQGSTWSADGRYLVFWREQNGRRALVAYDPASGDTTLLVDNAHPGGSDPLSASGSAPHRRIAVPWQEANGTFSVDLMQIDGTRRDALVRGASAINGIYWSPDGRTVLVQWLTRQGIISRHRLTWAHVDGSDFHILEDDGAEIDDLLWLRDGTLLVYTTRASDRFGVEMIDLESEQRHRLTGDLTHVERLEHDAAADLITFWWSNAQGEAGVDGYATDGRRAYRFRATEDIGHGLLLRAPGGEVGALLVGPHPGRSLQLAAADGSWTHTIRTAHGWMLPPRWSPDGTLLAFSYRDARGEMMFEIFTASGEPLRRFKGFDLHVMPTWTRCD